MPLLTNARRREKGILIAIEGIDGAGKTTQSKILYDKLKQEHLAVCLLHEPTGSIWGRKIQEIARNGRHNLEPKQEFELFHLDRKEDVKRHIIPALRKNMIVIMDRYYFSSVAYQSALGLDPDFIEKESEKIAPRPLLTIVLDVPSRIALLRIKNRVGTKKNHFERERYLTKVRKIFRERFEDRPEVAIIDGSRDIDTVASEIMNIVRPLLERNYASFRACAV